MKRFLTVFAILLSFPAIAFAFQLSEALQASAENIQLDLSLPDGFEIVEHADSTLAPDIYCLTLDPRGRVVVSSRGYIRILEDDDEDGVADRFIEFASGPKVGAMGMLWEGDRLYFTGEGGLRYYEDKNGDDCADGPSILVRSMKTGKEHTAHGIRRGPDGWLYTLCGNETGIDESFAELDTSPIQTPIAGCLIRFNPDLSKSEIVADGFRNAYDFDFNLEGDIFTYDSDNERCVSLPWYEYTRFYHVLEGGHYGWQNPQFAETWRKPPYFRDVIAPVAALDRGSPCGVECYRHEQFPQRYQGGFFILDWTFGRVYFLPLERSGATYKTSPEVFIEPVGNIGFAVTDLAVHPDSGDLFISIGGRGTRGAVYRVRHTKGYEGLREGKGRRASIAPRSLDWAPGLQPILLSEALSDQASDRFEALTKIGRYRSQFDDAQIIEVVAANWNHPDSLVRWKTSELIETLEDDARVSLDDRCEDAASRSTLAWGIRESDPRTAYRFCEAAFASTDDPDLRLECVRLFQILLGGLMDPKVKGRVHTGYSTRDSTVARQLVGRATPSEEFSLSPENGFPGYSFLEVIKSAFPSGDPHFDREIARTFAMIQSDDPEIMTKIAKKLGHDSDPIEDIHYLIVLSRLSAPRPKWITQRTAEALLDLDQKILEKGTTRDRNWPSRIGETHEALADKDPSLNDSILGHPKFGRSDHVLYARCPGFDRSRAAEKFLEKVGETEGYEWTASLIDLLAELPSDTIAPLLREQWENRALRRSIVRALAEDPKEEDRERFLWGLEDREHSAVRVALKALKDLPPDGNPETLAKILGPLRQLEREKTSGSLLREFAECLRKVSGEKDLTDRSEVWEVWFAETFPEYRSDSASASSLSPAEWRSRLKNIDWESGDPLRGNEIAKRLACTGCHTGARSLGPALAGISGRFSREDLLTTILEPNRDIPSRYRTTVVETADGGRFQGLVVYDAVDSLLLQNGPDETLQVDGGEIVDRWYSEVSLMPEGLFEGLSDEEIADLLSYLGGL